MTAHTLQAILMEHSTFIHTLAGWLMVLLVAAFSDLARRQQTQSPVESPRVTTDLPLMRARVPAEMS